MTGVYANERCLLFRPRAAQKIPAVTGSKVDMDRSSGFSESSIEMLVETFQLLAVNQVHEVLFLPPAKNLSSESRCPAAPPAVRQCALVRCGVGAVIVAGERIRVRRQIAGGHD